MKSDNESFDRLIREKVEQRAFEPDPGSWEKAQQLIDAEQSGRRRRVAFWLFFLFATGGLFAFFFFGPSGKNPSGKEKLSVNTTNETLHSADKNSSGRSNRAATNSSTGTKTPDLSQEVTVAPGFSKENSSTQNQAAAAGTNKDASSKTNSAVTGSNSKKTVQFSGKNSAGNKQPVKQKPAHPFQQEQVKTTVNSNSEATVSEAGNNSVADQHTENNPDTAEHTYASGTNEADSAKPYVSGMNHTDSAKPYNSGMNQADLAQAYIAAGKKPVANENPDEDNEDSNSRNQVPGRTAGWLGEAGFTFLPGTSSFNRSVNPVIGAGYYFPAGTHFGFEAGLQYTFLNHASDSSIVYTSTDYSFGVESHKTEIGLRRLHYLSVPLIFYWHFNEKNAVFAGGTFHYLLATESRERSYTELYNSIRDEQIRSVFGYDAGIKHFDLLASGGYAHYFGPHWSIQASGYYGLMDLKDNTLYGVSKFERNAGLRFTLQYRF